MSSLEKKDQIPIMYATGKIVTVFFLEKLLLIYNSINREISSLILKSPVTIMI